MAVFKCGHGFTQVNSTRPETKRATEETQQMTDVEIKTLEGRFKVREKELTTSERVKI